jgi:hypothetical protein
VSAASILLTEAQCRPLIEHRAAITASLAGPANDRNAASTPDRCARCRKWRPDGPGMRPINVIIIHLSNPDRPDCLIVYVQERRTASSAGFVAHEFNWPRGPPMTGRLVSHVVL